MAGRLSCSPRATGSGDVLGVLMAVTLERGSEESELARKPLWRLLHIDHLCPISGAADGFQLFEVPKWMEPLSTRENQRPSDVKVAYSHLFYWESPVGKAILRVLYAYFMGKPREVGFPSCNALFHGPRRRVPTCRGPPHFTAA